MRWRGRRGHVEGVVAFEKGVQKGVFALEKGAVALEKGVFASEKGTFALEKGAFALEKGAVALEKGAFALEKGTLEFEKGVFGREKGVFALEKGVVALETRGVRVTLATGDGRNAHLDDDHPVLGGAECLLVDVARRAELVCGQLGEPRNWKRRVRIKGALQRI